MTFLLASLGPLLLATAPQDAPPTRATPRDRPPPLALPGVPDWLAGHAFEQDAFTFVRIRYDSAAPGGRRSALLWATDFPDAELNLVAQLGHLTRLDVSEPSRVLRLTDFETSNGPDVRVLLIANSDATDNDTVKNSMPVELGKLKGNIGDQNYDVPAALDLAKYKAVTIWCNRFSVNFGTAPLS